ncbi:MAG: TetR/AcrR family transcriptional regulator [Nitrospirota bacterium]
MRQTADTKERILSSALDLIYARSYAAVGVQEICEHAGVKKGSFYHFFPSKQALTLAALGRQWNDARHRVWEAALTGRRPFRQKLERCFELFHEHQCGAKAKTGRVPGCPFGNLALELGTQDEVIRRKVDEILRECTGYVERALCEAIAAGELPDRDTVVAAETIVAFMEGAMLMAKTRNDPKLIKDLSRGLLRLLQTSTAGAGKARSRNGATKGRVRIRAGARLTG